MNKLFLLLILLITCTYSESQSLIQNGDFELYKRKKRAHMLAKKANYWFIPNRSTPDLISPYNGFREVSTQEGSNVRIQAISGESFLGIVAYKYHLGYREMVTNKLAKELNKDSIYCLTMYIALRHDCPFTINQVQFNLSSKRERYKKFGAYEFDYSYPNVSNGQYITNKYVWEKVCGIFKAQGDEKYLTIGNFVHQDSVSLLWLNNNQKVKSVSWSSTSVYFFIDNISLTPIQDSSQCDCNIKRIELSEIYKDTLMDENNEVKDSVIFKEGSRIELRNLFFEIDSYELKEESEDELKSLFKLLSKYPEISIQINGYTDNTGSEKRNLYLSENRARAVVDYLIEKGINEKRLKFKGYGSDNPIASNETTEGRAKNRRVEFVVIKEKD